MRTRRRVLTAVAVAGAFATLATTAPAGAATQIPAGDPKVLMAGGSDTTTFVVEALGEAYQNNAANQNKDRIVNVPPLHQIARLSSTAQAGNATNAWLVPTRQNWGTGAIVPGDADCLATRVYGGEGSFDANGNNNYGDAGDRRFTEVNVDADNDATAGEANVPGERVQLGWVAPNGSGSGRSFALDYTNNAPGCVDMARSSSAPSAGAQRSALDSWGFALDAIGWVYFPSNPHGVTALTRDQLNKIYTCSATDPSKPQISTWGELSGNPANTTRIRPYKVQQGSGTGEDVATVLLGLANNSQVGLNCDPNIVGTLFPTVQEHDCLNVSEAAKPDAICFYGYSRYRIQSRALEPDKRNGSRFGAFAASDTVTPLRPSGSTIREGAGRYGGTRIVYTVIPKGQGDGVTSQMPSFANVLAFTGVIPSTGINLNGDGDFTDPGEVAGTGAAQLGFACDGGLSRKIIRTYGLVPFQLGVTDPANAAYGESYCRHNVYSLGS